MFKVSVAAETVRFVGCVALAISRLDLHFRRCEIAASMRQQINGSCIFCNDDLLGDPLPATKGPILAGIQFLSQFVPEKFYAPNEGCSLIPRASNHFQSVFHRLLATIMTRLYLRAFQIQAVLSRRCYPDRNLASFDPDPTISA